MGRSNWSLKMLFILSETLLLIVTTTVSQPQFFHHKCSNNIGNYTNTSPFKKNLDTVLASISTNSQVDKGFYAIEGEEPNRATAMALCRGPVPPENCTICVKDATRMISQTCPNQKEAAGWYHDCQILYSNKTIQGVGDTSARILYFNTGKASDPIEFNQALGELLNGLREKLNETGTPTLKS
uniref:Gnk2-homologous domain-containing protein n=1 Tax=Cucumis melo TaxID=3656 RepID=A0A9I9CT32_CUCME